MRTHLQEMDDTKNTTKTSCCDDGIVITDRKFIIQQPSRMIPVLPFGNSNNRQQQQERIRESDDNHNDGVTSLPPPPDYAMIELNGELIGPIEYPSTNTCRSILGIDGQVELGKLEIESNGVSHNVFVLVWFWILFAGWLWDVLSDGYLFIIEFTYNIQHTFEERLDYDIMCVCL